MRFIGMHDMSGTEIYEGFRCEVYIDGEPPYDGWGKAIVKWNEECQCWMFEFYEGVEWGDDTEEPCSEFDESYIKVVQ